MGGEATPSDRHRIIARWLVFEKSSNVAGVEGAGIKENSSLRNKRAGRDRSRFPWIPFHVTASIVISNVSTRIVILTDTGMVLVGIQLARTPSAPHLLLAATIPKTPRRDDGDENQ